MVKPRMQPKNPEQGREKVNKYQGSSRQNNSSGSRPAQPRLKNSEMKTNRGEAIRAGRRNFDTADKAVDRWDVFEKHHENQASFAPLASNNVLRIIPLGGLTGIGEKNMMVIEYADDAIVVDCGFDLSVDLPGVNFAIPAIYLM